MPKPTAHWHQDAIKDLKDTNLSIAEIADKYGASPTMIRELAKENGIQKPPARRGPKKLLGPLSDQHNSIGTRLWRSRVDAGLTVSVFGARIGINSSALSSMENGQYDFTLSELQRILPLLGLTLEIRAPSDTPGPENDPDGRSDPNS